MRRAAIVLAIIGSLSLASCATTTSTQIDQTIAQVQAITQQVCKFVPTVATVAKIIATLAGAAAVIDTASTVAHGICDALTTAPQAEGPGQSGAYFRGVHIRGRYVK